MLEGTFVWIRHILTVQYMRLRGYLPVRGSEYGPRVVVDGEGLVGAVCVQGPNAKFFGPDSGSGTLRIGMMDRRHYDEDRNVKVMHFLSDREIAIKMGPLSSRRQRGPQDPPGGQRHQGRGYKP